MSGRKKNSVFRSLALVSQLGITVLTPVILCVAAGIYLDERFSTRFTLPLLLLGVLAGARSAWLLLKNEIRQDDGKDKEERNDQ